MIIETNDEPLNTTLAYMTCECHPWLEWPHDLCSGPGMPVGASLSLLHDLLRGDFSAPIASHLVVTARHTKLSS